MSEYSNYKLYICWQKYLLWFLMATCTTSFADEVTLVADEWCPYNCEPDSDRPGYLIEIARYSLEKKGHTVVYKTIPWARAIEMVRKGQYQGLVGAGKEEVPTFIFEEKPLSSIKHVFYALGDSTWAYTGLESLKNINLGVIKEYSYGSLRDEYIKRNAKDHSLITTLHGDEVLERLIGMLKYGRIDAFIEERNIFNAYQKSVQDMPVIKDVGVGAVEDIYIAFSPNNTNSSEYARAITEGMSELRTSGKLLELQKKYYLVDDMK